VDADDTGESDAMTTTQPGVSEGIAPGPVSRTVDRVMDRLLGLPRARDDYVVDLAIPTALDDGTVLVADHYRPAGTAQNGTILVRTPYGRGFPGSLLYGRIWAARGYHVLLQSCRGTFGSGGTFEPMAQEAADAQATVAWLRRQPWFDGRLGTLGGSYLGWTQWALMMDPPPELRASVVVVAPHDMAESAFGAGSFTLNDLLGWAYLMSNQEVRGPLGGDLIRSLTINRKLQPALRGLPLRDSVRSVLQDGSPWFLDWLDHPDLTDPFWDRLRVGESLRRADVPVLLIGGWQDVFLRHTVQEYEELHARGVDVSLTVGPWSHLNFVSRASRLFMRRGLGWLDEHLAGTGRRGTNAPVRIHVHGAGWRDLDAWPPPARQQVWYLQPGAALGTQQPPGDGAPSGFRYDPADPTPAHGGRRLTADAGMRDNRELESRADVLTFTGPPLAADADVVGRPVVEVVHGTDNPHADVFVRLCDVDRRGRSVNFSDGMVRVDPALPAGEPATVRVELDPCAHRLKAGHRLRLQVSGGAHPRFFRNPGTGEPPATALRLVPSTRAVHHGAGGVSRVVLPVVDG
jgi:putative CocE/NonD family hydrolase